MLRVEATGVWSYLRFAGVRALLRSARHVNSEWTSSNWSWQFLFLIYIRVWTCVGFLWRRDTSPHAEHKRTNEGKQNPLGAPPLVRRTTLWLVRSIELRSFSVCVFKWICAPSVEPSHEVDTAFDSSDKLPCYRSLNLELLKHQGKNWEFCSFFSHAWLILSAKRGCCAVIFVRFVSNSCHVFWTIEQRIGNDLRH